MMRFGTRAQDVEESKPFIRNLKKGETRVRFLQEINDWIQFREHFSTANRSFPCTKEPDCPGCTSPNEAVSRWSRKYAVNVLLVGTGQVGVIKIPVTLKNRMDTRSERNGNTVLERDFTLIRSGDGLSTEYDVEQEEKYAVDMTQYELFDIEQMLADQFESTIGAAEEPKGKVLHFDQSNEAVRARLDATKEQLGLDIPPTKPDEEEEEIVTEEDLKAMNLVELLHVADEVGLIVPSEISESKPDVLQFLMDNLQEA
jgi:hypothetical protein